MEEAQISALEEEQKLYSSAATEAVNEAPPAEEPVVEKPPVEEKVEEKPVEVAPTEEKTPVVEPEKQAPKTVPLSALLEERDKRQKAEQELAVFNAQRAERERIERERAEAQRQQQPTEDPIKAEVIKEIGARPKDDEDPIGAAEWDNRYKQQYGFTQTRRAAEQAQAVAQNVALETRLANERAEFTRENPDYIDALKWTVEQEKQDYMEAGMTEQQALWQVNQRAGELIQLSLQNGKSVAATFYNYCKRRGWKKPDPKPPTAEEKLATAEKGQRITSLDRGAGGSAVTELTDEQIDAMPQAEYREWIKNPNNARRMRQILGQE